MDLETIQAKIDGVNDCSNSWYKFKHVSFDVRSRKLYTQLTSQYFHYLKLFIFAYRIKNILNQATLRHVAEFALYLQYLNVVLCQLTVKITCNYELFKITMECPHSFLRFRT